MDNEGVIERSIQEHTSPFVNLPWLAYLGRVGAGKACIWYWSYILGSCYRKLGKAPLRYSLTTSVRYISNKQAYHLIVTILLLVRI